MKTYNHIFIALTLFFTMLLLSGCERNISVESTVYPDGSLDRSVTLHNSDSSNVEKNILGINKSSGWEVIIGPPSEPTTEEDKKTEVNITFKKHFDSVEEANREMNSGVDTMFHVASSFQKDNRWFYTYIEYRDTYRALNLFNTIPKEDYFTKEDFAFIDRLPAEGTPISKADSVYLARLNEKIFDLYGARTIFEEFYRHLHATMREYNVPSQWADSLTKKKEIIYQRFVHEGNLDDEDFISLVDDMGIPLPSAGRKAVAKKTVDIERRLEFMSDAYSGKFLHSITMPWNVVESNADSVVNNQLFWRPPVVKFLLSDYTMSVTSRKMNPWAIGISGLVVCVTVGLFFVRRR